VALLGGRVWLATYGAVFGFDGHELTVIDGSRMGLWKDGESPHVRCVFEDSKGRLWIGNNGVGVFVIDDERVSRLSELCEAEAASADAAARPMRVVALGEDRAVDPFSVALLGGAELPSLAVHANTELLVGNLLFADVELWSQTTESWTATGNTGPEVVWDSARAGWLADPAFGPVWRFDRDETSLDQPADDVHPRAMRVTLVVAAEEGRPKDGILQQPIEADTTVIELVNGERFPGATDGGWCKVEGEWVRYAERVGDELRGCRRGQRGTRPMPHAASSVIRVGRTVQFTIAFPHAKDDWNG
jgi:hypothetical protein